MGVQRLGESRYRVDGLVYNLVEGDHCLCCDFEASNMRCAFPVGPAK